MGSLRCCPGTASTRRVTHGTKAQSDLAMLYPPSSVSAALPTEQRQLRTNFPPFPIECLRKRGGEIGIPIGQKGVRHAPLVLLLFLLPVLARGGTTIARLAALLQPSRSSHPVNVGVQIFRGIEIHHHHDVGNVQASRCHVGSDQDRPRVLLERGNRGVAIALVLLSVDGHDRRGNAAAAVGVAPPAAATDFDDSAEIVAFGPRRHEYQTPSQRREDREHFHEPLDFR